MRSSPLTAMLASAGFLALALMLIPEEAFARGGRSSSSRGSFSRSSSSSRSSSRTSTSFSSRGSGSTKRITSVTKPSNATAADKAAFQSTAKSNSFNKSDKTFQDKTTAKEAATNDFKQKYASRYPTKFEAEPKNRPEYIPKQVRIEGQNRNVEWGVHNGVGGYYYPGASANTYILYNMTSDPYTRSRYMYRHGYDPTGSMYVGSRWSFVTVMMWVGGGMLIVIVVIYIYSQWSR